jgi:hypothetical protein
VEQLVDDDVAAEVGWLTCGPLVEGDPPRRRTTARLLGLGTDADLPGLDADPLGSRNDIGAEQFLPDRVFQEPLTVRGPLFDQNDALRSIRITPWAISTTPSWQRGM